MFRLEKKADSVKNTSNCVYLFLHPSGKMYVGQAVDLYRRVRSHQSTLQRKVHPNRYLQAVYERDGWVFEVVVLEQNLPVEDLTSTEQFWIDSLQVCDSEYGYNLCPVAGSSLGHTWTLSAKAKENHTRANRILAQDPAFVQKRVAALRTVMATQQWQDNHRKMARERIDDGYRKLMAQLAARQHKDPKKKATHVKGCRNAAIYRRLRGLCTD